MSGLRHKFKKTTYQIPEEYDETGKSFIVFRSDKSGDDDDEIAQMTTKVTVGDIDPVKARAEARKTGKSIESIVAKNVTQETVMSTEKATILHMAVEWGGPYFIADEDDVADPDVPDAVAGEVLPICPETVGLIDGDLRGDAVRKMRAVWAGRTEEEQADFREPAEGASESKRHGRRTQLHAVPKDSA